MDALAALTYVILGGVLGMVGQGIRVIVGIKKQLDQATPGSAWNSWFQPAQLVVTVGIALAVGAIAGVLSVLSEPSLGTSVTRSFMLAIIAAGYAGTDFIEGIMTKATPT
jgi:hypothetical protein